MLCHSARCQGRGGAVAHRDSDEPSAASPLTPCSPPCCRSAQPIEFRNQRLSLGVQESKQRGPLVSYRRRWLPINCDTIVRGRHCRPAPSECLNHGELARPAVPASCYSAMYAPLSRHAHSPLRPPIRSRRTRRPHWRATHHYGESATSLASSANSSVAGSPTPKRTRREAEDVATETGRRLR